MKGDTIGFEPGTYGTMGVPDVMNNPSARMLWQNAGWTDAGGSLWLFGGFVGNGGISDIWRYDVVTSQWTWMQGPVTLGQNAYHGTMYVSSPLTTPGARGAYNSWSDAGGNFWLFGGELYAEYNDLWKFDIQTLQWSWQGGPDLTDQPGISSGICPRNAPAATFASRTLR